MINPAAVRHQPLSFAGVAIDRYRFDEALTAVLKYTEQQPARVVFVYANCINVAQDDAVYRTALEQAEFVLNDGAGIEIAGRLLGFPVYDNLCGTDWIPALLARLAQRNNERVFLLGGRPGTAAAAAAEIRRTWPQLTVVGEHHGYFDDPEPVLKKIDLAAPTLLIAAMGVPRQELFLHTHWQRLTNAGVRLGIAGGAVLDFMTGNVPRAPQRLRRARLEWAYRLVLEPARLWRRYVLGNARFLGLLAAAWIKGRQ